MVRFLPSLILSITFAISFTLVNSEIIRLCTSFNDLRMQVNENETTELSMVEIPGLLMSTGSNTNFSVPNETSDLNCDPGKNLMKISLQLPSTRGPISLPKRNKTADRLRGKVGNQFTPDGYLEYNEFYYPPEQYCISSLSDTEIKLEFCPINCGQDGNLCIPRCCGIGEVVRLWNNRCEKVHNNQTPWSPFLYETPHQKVSENGLKAIKIRYSRPHLNCSPDNWPFSDIDTPLHNRTNNKGRPGIKTRMLKNGDLIYLSQETRTWINVPDRRYCIDGFLNWGKAGTGKYTGDEGHQVIFLCPELTDDHIVVNSTNVNPRIDDLYAGVLYTSSLFLLLTAAVHISLFDRQNIHGLTILSQSISLFFFYISYGTVYFMAQRRDLNSDQRSPQCLAVAIIAHFFFLTTFSWLTVVNFDLWLTFRSMRPVSRMSKKMRRFRLYSLIGWGVPVVLMSIFVFLDFYYRNYESEVPVPDYGVTSCYVRSSFRKQYLCSILTIVIPINLVMIISTFKVFYDFKHGKGPVLAKGSKNVKHSFKLFVKLFLVMGSIWSFDAIFCWFYNDGHQSPWFLIIIDCLMFFQAIAIFIIFCWNRRTLKQLEDKYPSFKVAFAPIKKLLKIPETISDQTDTTPATPGGMRKMSSTSMVSMEGTLERRVSN